jgi:ferrous iron transport protein A
MPGSSGPALSRPEGGSTLFRMTESDPLAGLPPGSASLAEAALGSTARVADVVGDDAVAIRLLEMGVTPGVTVRLVGQAPFGDPLELELRGYRLSIRRAEAARVMLVAR